MSTPRWPVRPEHRPKPRRKIVTQADVDPDLLRAFPGIVAESNLCGIDVWPGPGRPGRGWIGWEYELVPLDVAVWLPWAGEA